MAQQRLVRAEPSVWEQRWQERVEAWRQSGQTQKEFCREQGIALSSLSRWHRELPRRAYLRGQSVEAMPETAVPACGETLGWIPVRCSEGLLAKPEVMPEREASGRFEVVSPGGWVIRLDRQFDGASLRRLLDVLEELSC